MGKDSILHLSALANVELNVGFGEPFSMVGLLCLLLTYFLPVDGSA